jgi:TatD DNase family protein
MFDCHSHVQFAAFKGEEEAVIARAQAAGVSVINVGTQADTSETAIALAHKYQTGVYAAVGLHPVHTTKSFHDEAELGGGEAAKAFVSRGEKFDEQLYRRLAADPKVVALGECGLDYYRVTSVDAPTEDEWEQIKLRQKEVFLAHARIARDLGKALMIHCRPSKGTDDAYEDLLSLVAGDSSLQTVPKVLHFYVGSVAMTQKFLQAGFNFEFGGVITFAMSYDAQIKMIPLDRILTETDAPYVSPEPYRGQRNEPAYVTEVVKKLAQIKGVSYDEVAAATDANTRRIFNIRS